MTDWAVVGIITTIIVMGLTIIGVQITIFIYLLRRADAMSERIDALQKEFSKEFGALSERVARLEGILIARLGIGNGAFTQTGDD